MSYEMFGKKSVEYNTDRIRVEFEAVSENEAFARTVAAVYLSRFNPMVAELEDIKTAVSEAVTNAIIHGYTGARGKVVMECGVKRTNSNVDFEIVIEDTGKGIEKIDLAMKPMYTSSLDGERAGLGFTVMEAFMDELKVESVPNVGTRVSMYKRLEACTDGNVGEIRDEGTAVGERADGIGASNRINDECRSRAFEQGSDDIRIRNNDCGAEFGIGLESCSSF